MEFNRPKVLNALNISMIRELTPRLQRLEYEPTAQAIIFKGGGGDNKAFCAGGDIRSLYESAKSETHRPLAYDFFREEYRLNYLLSSMKKPVISVLNGITMGGGVGLSIHGKFVVATENSVFAMPETAIGFFPDVGASHKLPRLGAKLLSEGGQGLGTFLALSGFRVKGDQLAALGIATHFVPTKAMDSLESSISGLRMDDSMVSTRNESVNMALDMLEPFDPSENLDDEFLLNTEEVFGLNENDTVEGIFDRLENHNTEWARSTLANLKKMCPLSLKVTLQQMRSGATMNMKECLQMEYRIACRMMSNPDFVEGVRSVIIDKDMAPKWQHQDITQVSDEMVNDFFEPLEEELVLYETERPEL